MEASAPTGRSPVFALDENGKPIPLERRRADGIGFLWRSLGTPGGLAVLGMALGARRLRTPAAVRAVGRRTAVHDLLAAVRRRLRLTWTAATLQWVAPAVALVALGLVLVGRVRPWAWPEPAALVVRCRRGAWWSSIGRSCSASPTWWPPGPPTGASTPTTRSPPRSRWTTIAGRAAPPRCGPGPRHAAGRVPRPAIGVPVPRAGRRMAARRRWRLSARRVGLAAEPQDDGAPRAGRRAGRARPPRPTTCARRPRRSRSCPGAGRGRGRRWPRRCASWPTSWTRPARWTRGSRRWPQAPCRARRRRCPADLLAQKAATTGSRPQPRGGAAARAPRAAPRPSSSSSSPARSPGCRRGAGGAGRAAGRAGRHAGRRQPRRRRRRSTRPPRRWRQATSPGPQAALGEAAAAQVAAGAAAEAGEAAAAAAGAVDAAAADAAGRGGCGRRQRRAGQAARVRARAKVRARARVRAQGAGTGRRAGLGAGRAVAASGRRRQPRRATSGPAARASGSGSGQGGAGPPQRRFRHRRPAAAGRRRGARRGDPLVYDPAYTDGEQLDAGGSGTGPAGRDRRPRATVRPTAARSRCRSARCRPTTSAG